MNVTRKRAESGAELLARLNRKTDVQIIDPFIFSDSSSVSSSSTSSSSAQLVEIFGPEGSGKTELALHCAAKVCLPASTKGVQLNGLGAKVIFIDTDCKFSILRFVVLLEKQIKHIMSKKSNSNKKEDNLCKNKTLIDTSSDMIPSRDVRRDSRSSEEIVAGLQMNEEEEKREENCVGLTMSDIEEIITESLERFVLLKVSNSQQLLSTLVSLEDLLVGDDLSSMMIIDSISAFYWMDRAACSDSKVSFTSSVERIMAPIASAVSRLVKHFGITCLAITAALLTGKTYGNNNDSVSDVDANSWMNSEFLGKSWSFARRKRIALTRNQDKETSGQNIVHAFCSVRKTSKSYLFHEDFFTSVEKPH